MKINVKCCENFNNILLLIKCISKLERNDNGKYLQGENAKTEEAFGLDRKSKLQLRGVPALVHLSDSKIYFAKFL